MSQIAFKVYKQFTSKKRKKLDDKLQAFTVLLYLLSVWVRFVMIAIICWFSMLLATEVDKTLSKINFDADIPRSDLIAVEKIASLFYYVFTLGLVTEVLMWCQQNGAFYALGHVYS
jgi:uncharacterized membrane protein (DUF485 family)